MATRGTFQLKQLNSIFLAVIAKRDISLLSIGVGMYGLIHRFVDSAYTELSDLILIKGGKYQEQ